MKFGINFKGSDLILVRAEFPKFGNYFLLEPNLSRFRISTFKTNLPSRLLESTEINERDLKKCLGVTARVLDTPTRIAIVVNEM